MAFCSISESIGTKLPLYALLHQFTDGLGYTFPTIKGELVETVFGDVLKPDADATQIFSFKYGNEEQQMCDRLNAMSLDQSEHLRLELQTLVDLKPFALKIGQSVCLGTFCEYEKTKFSLLKMPFSIFLSSTFSALLHQISFLFYVNNKKIFLTI